MNTGDCARMIRIYFGEDDRWQGKPLHEAIVEEAQRHDLAGATVYRGIEGYGASTRIHRRHLLTSDDLPMMVCIVDRAEKIDAFLPVLETMVKEGLIAMSNVEVIRYVQPKAPPFGRVDPTGRQMSRGASATQSP